MLIWIALALLQDPVEMDRPTILTEPKRQEKEIVVIGQRRESDVLDVPSSVTLVTGKQIEESGATNIVEVLQKTPGFSSAGYGRPAADQNLDLRGYNNGAGNGQRTLVLVDGRKTNGVATSSTDWASIPLENIERIEVVRGPAAALYGDTALAGVVNIITRKGGKETFSQTQAEAGNWGSYRAAANLGGTSDGVLYDVYAGIEGTDGYRDHADYTGNNFTGRVELPLASGLRGFLKVGRHEDERERPGSLSKADIAQFGRKASVIDGSPSESERDELYLDLGFTQELGGLGELGLFLNHTQGESASVFFSAFGDFFIDDASRITMFQFKHVVAPRLFGQEAVFTTGLDASIESADAASVFIAGPEDESEYRRRMIGAYTHVEIRPLPFLVVAASLRWDRALLDLESNPAFGAGFDRQRPMDQVSPHAGVTWKILDELSAFASVGRTFKYPTRDELIGFTAAVPDLDPERALIYETGVRAWSSRWGSASVSGYWSRVKDEIFFDPSFPSAPPFFFGASVNFDEVTHNGIESELRATPVEGIEVFATHTFVRAVISDSDNPAQEGKQYPVTPRLAGTVGGTLRLEGASLTVLGRYTGERYLVNDFTNVLDPLGSYWMMDVRLAYEVAFVKFHVGVYNVFDREVFDNGGFSTATATERFSPASERSWMIGGEVRF